jgi:hypothetical protein
MTDVADSAADGHQIAISRTRQQVRLLFLDAFLHELGQPLNLATMARHNLEQALHTPSETGPLAAAVTRRLALLEKAHQRLGALLATYRMVGRPSAPATWQEMMSRLNLLLSVETRSEAAVLDLLMDGSAHQIMPPPVALELVVALLLQPNLNRGASGLRFGAAPAADRLRLSAIHAGEWAGWVISPGCSEAATDLGLRVTADGRECLLSWAHAAA